MSCSNVKGIILGAWPSHQAWRTRSARAPRRIRLIRHHQWGPGRHIAARPAGLEPGRLRDSPGLRTGSVSWPAGRCSRARRNGRNSWSRAPELRHPGGAPACRRS
ncbi:hypothetical protein NDU88_003403 [Pleurodeles waltl]|uniref:Uncharacterized protein n=1 Tax=Pleurodeles waltl TaxID=8319 RepID=A0AAV7VHQ9_PLEWA|nr:hypothetical protein NDU88_003403 [Pleurodeles waltl]